MNLAQKKLIAKEFLLLVSCLMISFISFLVVYPINLSKQKETTQLINDSIQKLAEQYYENDDPLKLNELAKVRYHPPIIEVEDDRAIVEDTIFMTTYDSVRLADYIKSRNVISPKKQIDIAKNSFLISFSLLFLLRYLLLGIRWSIRTLRFNM